MSFYKTGACCTYWVFLILSTWGNILLLMDGGISQRKNLRMWEAWTRRNYLQLVSSPVINGVVLPVSVMSLGTRITPRHFPGPADVWMENTEQMLKAWTRGGMEDDSRREQPWTSSSSARQEREAVRPFAGRCALFLFRCYFIAHFCCSLRTHEGARPQYFSISCKE